MGASKNASAYVGRMGALAVALGVGAAIANGAAVAWADDSPGAGAAGSTASSPGRDAGSTSAGPTSTGASARSRKAPADSGASGSKSGKSAASRTVVTSSGGAVTSGATPSSAPSPQSTAPSSLSSPAPAAATGTTAVTEPVSRVITPPKPAAIPVAAPVVSRILSAVGLPVPGAATSPVAPTPAPSPAIWTLAAWARREIDSAPSISPVVAATTTAQAAQSAAVAAAATTSTGSLATRNVGWVTGPGITNGFGIYGTDLGIMWEYAGRIQLAFGDTFSGPNMTGDWRSNALLLSTDTNLTNGLSLLQTGYAYQFIPSAPGALFPILNSEVTIIPTSAVTVGQQEYVNYMSVKSWDTPGRWTTNYSAMSQFVPGPNGGQWVLVPSTIRSAGWFRSSTPYVPGSQNFQQAAYVLEPTSQVADGEPQYLYAFGTPSGRAGSAYLSRVAVGSETDLTKYQYWDGSNWVQGKPAVATPILGDSTSSPGLFGPIIDLANNPNFFGGWFAGLTGAKTGGNVSEMSVQYNQYLNKYVVLYANGQNNVVLRTADRPEGPWSDPITIATSAQYPGLYAPMIHPWSGTGKLVDSSGDPDVSNLYWNMSLWGPYNVTLMQTDLTPLHTTVV